jgi:hypothetical protein
MRSNATGLGIGAAPSASRLMLGPCSTALAHINFAAGTAPSSPNNGDVWFDGTDFKARVGGATKTFTIA